MRTRRFVCPMVLALVLPVTLGLGCGLKRDWNICAPEEKQPCLPGYVCTADLHCVRASDGGSDGLVAVDNRGDTGVGGLDGTLFVGSDGPSGRTLGPDAGTVDGVPAFPVADAAVGPLPGLDGPEPDRVPVDAPVAAVADAPAADGPLDAPAADGPPDAPVVSGPSDAAAPDVARDAPAADAPGTCSADKDCVGRPGTPFCGASGLCVGCAKRSDCVGACQTCSNSVCAAVKNQDDPGVCLGTCDANGTCKSRQGQSCQLASTSGCLSGTTCAPDGICCDTACDSPCMACDTSGFLGTCKAVASGQPHGNRTSCGTDATCGGTCAGKADGTCSYPTKNCGAGPTCTGGSFTDQSMCSSGSCGTPKSSNCPYGCNSQGTACNLTDPCSPSPCLNGGSCSPSGGTYTCSCINGYSGNNCQTPPTPPSCVGLTTKCQGESCCTTIKVTGGTFPMGRSEVSGTSDYYPDAAVILPEETPEHNATVSDFGLDKYEVTVGRFRAFVGAYNTWHAAGNPKTNAGAHPIAPLTGWGRSWMSAATDLPTDAAALTATVKCSTYSQTWKDTADTNEAYPINCVNWFVAFAFCVWDGGRLPTEAEWEYAAAGGAGNQLYPWGNAEPDATRANYFGSDDSPLVAVGSKVSLGGAGAFGHADLAGSVSEWVFDWFSSSYYGISGAPSACSNCANTAQGTNRGMRGGAFWSSAMNLRAAFRGQIAPDALPYYTNGIRCARIPQ